MAWIKYDTDTLVLISKHDNEPTVSAGESKADVGNHYFVPGQSLENYKYESNTIVERTDTEVEETTFDDNYVASINSELPLINQTTAYEPFFIREVIPNVTNGVWSWEVPFDGDFRLEFYYRYSINNTNVNFEAHITMDSTEFLFPHIEGKDSGGGGVTAPRVQNGQLGANVNSGTDQFLTASGAKSLEGLTKGTIKTFELEFAAEGTNLEACIYEANLFIFSYKNKNS
jgi:hypothetical protein